MDTINRPKVLSTIMLQLIAIYSLDNHQAREVYADIIKYDDVRLADVLEKLIDFRRKQIQTIDQFVRKNIYATNTQKEEVIRDTVKIPLIF